MSGADFTKWQKVVKPTGYLGKCVWPDGLKRSGVYCIKDPSGQMYIGQAGNIQVRLGNHFNNGPKGWQRSAIQEAIFDQGYQNFSYRVVKFMDGSKPQDRNPIENHYISQLGTRTPNGYNEGGETKWSGYATTPELVEQLRDYAQKSGQTTNQTIRSALDNYLGV